MHMNPPTRESDHHSPPSLLVSSRDSQPLAIPLPLTGIPSQGSRFDRLHATHSMSMSIDRLHAIFAHHPCHVMSCHAIPFPSMVNDTGRHQRCHHRSPSIPQVTCQALMFLLLPPPRSRRARGGGAHPSPELISSVRQIITHHPHSSSHPLAITPLTASFSQTF